MKAKKEIRNFLIGSFIWVLFFRVLTGEKISSDLTHVGLGLVVIIAASGFIEYRARKKSNQKGEN
ncbi:MAG: hypothetical protein WBA84_07920 [Carnobacterium sp.]|uniref:hypothetical protein n=1 Tax=Carnobacterium sp. TaxID=48221 RepID=UPI003C7174D3